MTHHPHPCVISRLTNSQDLSVLSLAVLQVMGSLVETWDGVYTTIHLSSFTFPSYSAQLQYLIHSLGKRGVLEEEDYGQLLKQPYSSLRIDWDGQCSLLEYAVCYVYIPYISTYSEWLRHTPILIFTQFLLYLLYFEQVLKTRYMF